MSDGQWWNPTKNLSPEMNKVKRKMKKEKKKTPKELSKKEYWGYWEPYSKLKPFIRIKVFLLLWLPFISYFSYWTYAQYLAGDLACEGTACGTIFDPIFNIGAMSFVSGFVFYGFITGIYLNLPVFRHPGWLDLTCPECGYEGKSGQDDKGYAENWFMFGWDRVQSTRCPKCRLEFEVASMAQIDWPFDDEPHPSKKYGDSTKIRIKPKIPLRMGPFVWRKSNPRFGSDHWELIKIFPAFLLLYGLHHFSLLPENFWDWVFGFVIVYTLFFFFVWMNPIFRGLRLFVEEFFKDVIFVPLGLAKEDYVLPKYLVIITNLMLILIGLILVYLIPEFFEYFPLIEG